MLTLNLPVPPSVNAAFVNRKRGTGRGRIKSRAYRQWIRDADATYFLNRVTPIAGPYRVTIELPSTVRGDIDNRLKCTLDWLASRNLTPDDSLCRGIQILRVETTHDLMRLRIDDA